MSSSDDFLRELQQKKDDYYNSHKKNFFFKKSQKNDCALEISRQYPPEVLVRHCMYRIGNSNLVYFDYNIFKIFACDENYDIFTSYSYELYTDIFSKYDTIEIHMTLQSFTISAFERYFPMIRKYMTSGPDVTSRMSRLYIYHTPGVIEQMARIMSPFISHFANRIVYYSKKESDDKLAALFIAPSSQTQTQTASIST